MATQLPVETNSNHHWVLTCLALYQDASADGATTRELYEAADGIFANAQRASHACSTLYHDRSVLERVDDDSHPRAHRYYLTDAGWKMLTHIGEPDRTPDGRSVKAGVVTLPASEPPATTSTDESQTVTITDDPDEAGHEPGPFTSAKARRRYFAQKSEAEYVEWLESEWAPEHTVTADGTDPAADPASEPESQLDEIIALNQRADANGSVSFEGEEQLLDEVFGTDEDDAPETVDLSPDWDWLGTQLVKLGFVGLAREAYAGRLTPSIVYGDVLELIHEHANDPDVDLDLEPPCDGALTMAEVAPDPTQVAQFKQALGVETDSADTSVA